MSRIRSSCFACRARDEPALRRRFLRAQRLELGPIGDQLLTPEMGLSAVTGSNAETNLEQPSRDGALAAEGVQSPMHDQEYLLVDVVDVRLAHAHPVECPPHELSVTLVHLSDRKTRLTLCAFLRIRNGNGVR